MKQATIISVVLIGLAAGALIFLTSWHIPAPSDVVSKVIEDDRFKN